MQNFQQLPFQAFNKSVYKKYCSTICLIFWLFKHSESIKNYPKLSDIQGIVVTNLRQLFVWILKIDNILNMTKTPNDETTMKMTVISLCKIHCTGVAHCDLKRDNILLGFIGRRGFRKREVIFIDIRVNVL